MLQHLSPESWGPTQQLAQSEQTGIAHRNSSLLPVVAEKGQCLGLIIMLEKDSRRHSISGKLLV